MNPSELTLLVLRFGFLLLLWLFVFGIVYALRTDLFGQRVRKLPESQAAASPFPTPAAAPAPAPAPAPVAVPAGPTEPVMKHAPVSSLPAGANTAGGGTNASVQTAHRLVLTSGPRAGTELALGRDPLTIARSPSARRPSPAPRRPGVWGAPPS